MRDPVQPRSESRQVFQFAEVLVGFEEHVLGHVQGILAITHQPEYVVEDALLPARDEEVVRLDVPTPGLNDQVAVFDEVMTRLMEKIDRRVLAELSNKLAPVDNAPGKVVGKLESIFSDEELTSYLDQVVKL